MSIKIMSYASPFLLGSKSKESTLKAWGTLWDYKVVGCLLPTPKCHTPPLYHLWIFAPDHVASESQVWCFVSQLKKIKKACGKSSTVDRCSRNPSWGWRTFSTWLCSDSLSGTYNLYWQYRDLITAGAVTQCHWDTGALHRAWAHSIQTMKVEETATSKCHQPSAQQFSDSKIEFPLPHRLLRHQHKPCCITKRPNTFF